MKSSSAFRRRTNRAALWLLLALFVWILYTWARSTRLLANARDIERRSANFPRDYQIGNVHSPRLTYLAMGDSTAAGWGAREVSQTYPYRIAQSVAAQGFRVRVVNVAIGGAQLKDVNRIQLRALKQVRPDLITLSVGANDATRFVDESDYRREFQILFAALRSSSAQTILVANAPDMFQVPALPWPFAVAVNRRARRLNSVFSEEISSSTIRVDLYGRGKLIYRRNPNLYASDFFHPSGDGYEIWAQVFVDEWNRGKARP